MTWTTLQNYGERFVTNRAALALSDRRAYVASTGKVSLAVAGNFRTTLENPTASGKKLVITSLAVFDTASSAAWADIRLGPTTGLPTANTVTPRNAVMTNSGAFADSIAVVKWDTDTTTPLGGGVLFQQVGIPSNSRTVFGQGYFVVTAGTLVGINAAFAGASDVNFTVYYYEEAV